MSRTASALAALALGLALPSATPALAADAFNGPFVGAFATYADIDAESTAVVGSSTFAGDMKGDGFGFGAYAGLGWTFGPAYVGAEADYGWSEFRADVNPANIETTIDGDRTYGVSGRAGVVLMDQVLIYGRVGKQWTKMDLATNIGTASVATTTQTVDGWRYGGGVEYALGGTGSGSNLLARIEYTRISYGELSVATSAVTNTAEVDENLFRIGFAWKIF